MDKVIIPNSSSKKDKIKEKLKAEKQKKKDLEAHCAYMKKWVEDRLAAQSKITLIINRTYRRRT
jgi:hypothetical protein